MRDHLSPYYPQITLKENAHKNQLAQFEQFYNSQIRYQAPKIIARFRKNLSHFKCAISRAKMPGVGDFNQMKLSSLCRRFNLKKSVKAPTRGTRVLDQILTNMSDLYKEVVFLQIL